VPIASDATAGGLSETLAGLGGEMIVAALDLAEQGRLTPRPQPQEGVTYAPKVTREEGRLDWCRPAVELERRVRAFDPWPGAFFDRHGEPIRVRAAAALPEPCGATPGTVLDEALAIACNPGVLRLLELQRPGRRPLDREAFLRGYPIPAGTLLPCPATS
jgi:methionyl-tRNA formyltransferase